MKLKFEQVSDVNDEYCHMDVFYEGNPLAFMDVSIGEDKRPRFNFYGEQRLISLSVEELKAILEKAEVFTMEEVASEIAFQRSLVEMAASKSKTKDNP